MPIIIIVVAIIVMLFALVPAAALVCHVSPGDTATGFWAWRTVDGRKCWYQGRKKFPREQLRWPQRSAGPVDMAAEDDPSTRAQDEPQAAPGHAPWLRYRPINIVPARAPPLGELTGGVSVTSMRPIPDSPDSFEMRWKGAP